MSVYTIYKRVGFFCWTSVWKSIPAAKHLLYFTRGSKPLEEDSEFYRMFPSTPVIPTVKREIEGAGINPTFYHYFCWQLVELFKTKGIPTFLGTSEHWHIQAFVRFGVRQDCFHPHPKSTAYCQPLQAHCHLNVLLAAPPSNAPAEIMFSECNCYIRGFDC